VVSTADPPRPLISGNNKELLKIKFPMQSKMRLYSKDI
jgi:hypothetical protein